MRVVWKVGMGAGEEEEEGAEEGGGEGGLLAELLLIWSSKARLGVSWDGFRRLRVIGEVEFVESHSRIAERS